MRDEGRGTRGERRGTKKTGRVVTSSFVLRPSSLVFLLLTACCLLPTDLWASDLRVTTKVDRDTITVGDPIIYTISIVAAKGVSVKPSVAKVNIYPFEVMNYNFDEKLLSKPAGEDEKVITIEYTISAYSIGEYGIPPIEIAYTDESGAEKRAATEIRTVKVKSILPEGAKNLRDIKGPLSLKERKINGEGRRNILFLLFFAFALFLFAVFYIISRKKEKGIEPPESAAPSEIALGELEGIKALSLFEKGEIKRYYALIADAVRRFIAVRFNVDAARRTSGEILEVLRGIHSLNGQVELFAGFLHDCDIVKFSKYNPTAEEARSIIKRAEEIIKG